MSWLLGGSLNLQNRGRTQFLNRFRISKLWKTLIKIRKVFKNQGRSFISPRKVLNERQHRSRKYDKLQLEEIGTIDETIICHK